MQTDVEYRFKSDWRFSAGYLYNNAKVTDGGVANAALVGKYLPQVPEEPRHAAGGVHEPEVLQRRDRHPDLRPAVQRRSERQGVQPAALAEAGYSTDLGRACRVTRPSTSPRRARSAATSRCSFGAQNLFDREYFVGTLPDTIGTPRLVNVGVRLRFGGT